MLIALLAARIERLSEHLIEGLYMPAEHRVWRRLRADLALYPSAGGPVVVPLTQEDLGGLAGMPTATEIVPLAATRSPRERTASLPGRGHGLPRYGLGSLRV